MTPAALEELPTVACLRCGTRSLVVLGDDGARCTYGGSAYNQQGEPAEPVPCETRYRVGPADDVGAVHYRGHTLTLRLVVEETAS